MHILSRPNSAPAEALAHPTAEHRSFAFVASRATRLSGILHALVSEFRSGTGRCAIRSRKSVKQFLH
jgi:hypothetical protein